LTLGLSLGVAGPASAADVATRLPVYTKAPPVAPTWTGFYVGVNAGEAWTDPASVSESDNIADGGSIFGIPIGPNFFDPNAFSLSSQDFVGGVHAGFNYQFAPTWVAGIEGDFEYAHLGQTGSAGPLTIGSSIPFIGGFPFPGSSYSATATVKDPWSIRGRLGYAQPTWMVYGTGGVAGARVDFSTNAFVPATFLNPDLTAPASISTTRTGWVAGAGVEFRPFGNPWILGFEYLYYKFDGTTHLDAAFNPPFAFIFTTCSPGVACIHSSLGDLDMQSVRARISYKFN
jgi:outer membrane immunogenic protein